MAAEFLLVNPRRKKRVKKSRKVRSRRRSRTVARKAPRRRRHTVTVSRRKRHKNPRASRRVSSRRRRNPRVLSGLSLGGLKSALIPALVGGAGAVALDAALTYIPLPVALQSGVAKTAVKVAGAVGLGFIAGKVVGKEKGRAVMVGALTVLAYGVVRDLVRQYVPQITLVGDLDDQRVVGYNPAAMLTRAYQPDSVGAYMESDVGAYMSDGM